MTRLAALLVLCGTVVWAAGPQQTPFHGATEIVPIYATVTDKDGRLVPDLSKADFQIRDNGKVQPIAVFSNEIQPVTIIIMMDRSGSMMSHSEVVEHAAEKFVEQLLPADRARIGDLSKRIRIRPTDFISDRVELVRILRKDLQDDLDGPSPIWTAVHRTSVALSAESGRRVALLFTDGHDLPAFDQVRTSYSDLLARVLEDEVMVYSIGVPAEVPAGGLYLNGQRVGGGMKFEPPDKHLRELSEATGGGFVAFDWAQNLNEAFARVADELHHQYLLGFVPQKLDAKTHQIELRVNQPGLKARARKSYVADTKTQAG